VNTVVDSQATESQPTAAVLDGVAITSDTAAVSDGSEAADVLVPRQDTPGAVDADDAGESDEDPVESDEDPVEADTSYLNLDAVGEPSAVAARPMGVTETLTVNALMPEIAFTSEAAVPEALQAGAAWEAADAVTEIYRSHYNQLVRLSVLLVHDVQTAEEVVQESFEAMHQAWKRLRDSEKALQYLRQTVVNKSRSVLRHRKVVDLHAPKPAPDEPSAEQAALAILERSAVAAALRSLPERQREAIALRYYADFSEADIAKAMGISRGAVKSHTARAMAALKSILTQETP